MGTLPGPGEWRERGLEAWSLAEGKGQVRAAASKWCRPRYPAPGPHGPPLHRVSEARLPPPSQPGNGPQGSEMCSGSQRARKRPLATRQLRARECPRPQAAPPHPCGRGDTSVTQTTSQHGRLPRVCARLPFQAGGGGRREGSRPPVCPLFYRNTHWVCALVPAQPRGQEEPGLWPQGSRGRCPVGAGVGGSRVLAQPQARLLGSGDSRDQGPTRPSAEGRGTAQDSGCLRSPQDATPIPGQLSTLRTSVGRRVLTSGTFFVPFYKQLY